MRIPLEDGTLSPDYSPRHFLERECEQRRYKWGKCNAAQMRKVRSTFDAPLQGGPGWTDSLGLRRQLALYDTREYADHRFAQER